MNEIRQSYTQCAKVLSKIKTDEELIHITSDGIWRAGQTSISSFTGGQGMIIVCRLKENVVCIIRLIKDRFISVFFTSSTTACLIRPIEGVHAWVF